MKFVCRSISAVQIGCDSKLLYMDEVIYVLINHWQNSCNDLIGRPVFCRNIGAAV